MSPIKKQVCFLHKHMKRGNTVRIGLLGVGTIGSGVVEVVDSMAGVELVRMLDVAVRMPRMTCDPEEIFGDASIGVVVEAMGGVEPAATYAEKALRAGKHFVTANKALVAARGAALDALAREMGVAFLFGASCGGSIPYLRNVRDARRVEKITAVGGILNGTTNYMLDLMQRGGGDYADALARAQALGYAERDPSADVDGVDAARKLCLACGVAFDRQIGEGQVPTAGIRHIAKEDIGFFREMGLVCRLTARAGLDGDALYAAVEPTLTSPASLEAGVCLNLNVAWYEGPFGGRKCFVGQGAGKLPTASNIACDLADIQEGRRHMFTEALRPSRVENGGQSRRYAVCLPRSARWCLDVEREETRGERRVLLTRPLRVEAMHAAARAAGEGAFFAGIAE